MWQIPYYFAEKMWVAFAFAKATHIFFSKNNCELDIVLTRAVNILTTYELRKLTMLWTTGPWCFSYFSTNTCIVGTHVPQHMLQSGGMWGLFSHVTDHMRCLIGTYTSMFVIFVNIFLNNGYFKIEGMKMNFRDKVKSVKVGLTNKEHL